MDELLFTRRAYDAVVDHARARAPAEVCGVLAGERDAGRVTGVHRTANAAATPETRYRIDPREQLAVMEAVADVGDDVVGFYHSHPAGPPAPSETDAAQATWKGYPYVVVALDGEHPFVGAWEWTGRAFDRLAVGLA
ncbi:MAG: desampylase [Haloarculaceae archaeon]